MLRMSAVRKNIPKEAKFPQNDHTIAISFNNIESQATETLPTSHERHMHWRPVSPRSGQYRTPLPCERPPALHKLHLLNRQPSLHNHSAIRIAEACGPIGSQTGSRSSSSIQDTKSTFIQAKHTLLISYWFKAAERSEKAKNKTSRAAPAESSTCTQLLSIAAQPYHRNLGLSTAQLSARVCPEETPEAPAKTRCLSAPVRVQTGTSCEERGEGPTLRSLGKFGLPLNDGSPRMFPAISCQAAAHSRRREKLLRRLAQPRATSAAQEPMSPTQTTPLPKEQINKHAPLSGT